MSTKYTSREKCQEQYGFTCSDECISLDKQRNGNLFHKVTDSPKTGAVKSCGPFFRLTYPLQPGNQEFARKFVTGSRQKSF